jgi:hypothetical protein
MTHPFSAVNHFYKLLNIVTRVHISYYLKIKTHACLYGFNKFKLNAYHCFTKFQLNACHLYFTKFILSAYHCFSKFKLSAYHCFNNLN